MNRFQGPVLNFIYRMLGDRAESEDLAQEVFVAVFKKIDSFRGDSSLSTWVFRIASNTCKNRKKYFGRRKHDRVAQKEQLESVASDTELITTSSRISRPDEMVEGLQTERMIQKAIGDLEENHRMILVLRDIQNMSYDDISVITGLPLGTVKSRLHRARMCLKEQLASSLR